MIWSEDYKKLADWYIDKLDLTVLEKLDHPEDTGVGFQVGNVYLWIGQHSKVQGKNYDGAPAWADNLATADANGNIRYHAPVPSPGHQYQIAVKHSGVLHSFATRLQT